MQALTDAWNSPTDEQKRDFTSNAGDYGQASAAHTPGGNSARLVDDEWHEEISADNQAADTHERAAETTPHSNDGGAQHLSETRDGADPESEESFRPLYYTKGDIDTARNMYQIAAQHKAQPPAAN